VVDVPRVAALLQVIRDEVAALRRSAMRDDGDLLGDDDAVPAVRYRFVVAIEAATDFTDHLIASEGLRPPTSFADSFGSLNEAGLLDIDLAVALQDAARFRNLLVHRYAEVDDTRVLEILRTRLEDFDRFVAAISARLLEQSSGRSGSENG
jgi:uncharacterized protein YutE (UPF0331/DUF86 family)